MAECTNRKASNSHLNVPCGNPRQQLTSLSATYPSWNPSLPPSPENDMSRYRMTSGSWLCPLLMTVKINPDIAGSNTWG